MYWVKKQVTQIMITKGWDQQAIFLESVLWCCRLQWPVTDN